MDIEQPKRKYATLAGKYYMVRSIGAGFNSKVKLGVNLETGVQYAIKILKDVSNKLITNEIGTLDKLNHPNIINLVDYLQNVEYVKKNGVIKRVTAIVLELAPGGEVFEFLFRTGRFSEEVARFYFRNLIESLEYIHGQGYTHRDLKPENLLFKEDFSLKLADFGFSTLISGRDGKGLLTSNLGTKGYMAPEIILKTPYHGPSVDLFAAGVILFIMYCGSPPFSDAQPNDAYYKLIVTNKHDSFWFNHSRNKPENFFSPELKDLLNFMLAFDPAQRLNISEIKAHPWYNGPVPSFDAVKEEMWRRNIKVQEELAREKEEKRLQALRKKNAAPLQKPGGPLFNHYPKPTNREVAIQPGDSNELEAKFPNLKLERVAAQYDEKGTSIKKNDYFCADNIQNSLIALLYVLKQKCNDIVLSDKTYKVSAKIIEEDESEAVQLNIRLFKNDENTTYIRFEKQSGNCMKYLETVKFFEQSLNELTKTI